LFHGVGDAVLSGVADSAGVGETAGAVVVSGASEAGGGNETSDSGGGSGATSVGDARMAGACPCESPASAMLFGFLFGALAATSISFTAASPIFERS
jgi:hypothetical protein